MGKPTGFMEIARLEREYAPVSERIKHYAEFVIPLSEPAVSQQGARCMDCGIPYCHNGCPINNLIPDWNDLVYHQHWQEALETLHSTNNFPEFTGRICPAPCEAACTLNLDDQPVAIKTIECAIVDKGWQEQWIVPQIPPHKTGKTVAIVGSGPAGLACAQQLARAGHQVEVFEKNNRMGGLLRYGIPDFKMEKGIIDLRLSQMSAEGVAFHPNTLIGSEHYPAHKLLTKFDAIVLAGGAEQPRELTVPGRELQGVYPAMTFLTQQNRRVAQEAIAALPILATGKRVVVIGGGDTGSDCIGTAIRQGAVSVTQLEILPEPPEHENKATVWPYWPNKKRTSSSQEEGCTRRWSVATQALTGANGQVTALHGITVDWQLDAAGRWQMRENAGTEFTLEADLVLLAMGFMHPLHDGLINALGVAKDARGNVAANTTDYQTSLKKVFTAGDMRRGQSLVVWAIREGRQAARAVDEFLQGHSDLPR